ncbi:MAG TPA: polysaccharide deacetylase family protein [Solirubrobacterales bacterium]
MADPLRNRSRAAAFLCYHSIHEDGPEWLSVAPSTFAAQLEALSARGWGSGTESDLRGAAAGRAPGERPLAYLTFDDGFADNHETAFPLLRDHGLTAMFFVLPSHLDGRALDWPEVAGDHEDHPEVMRSLTWAQVEEMAEAGMEFGSHGLAHSHLPELSDEELRQELVDSRRLIAERLGSCAMLAYPFGDWDGRVAAAAAEAGYEFAFTLPRSHQRRVGPLSIPRVSVDFRDDAGRFAMKLRPLGRRLYLSRLKTMLRR